MELSVDGRQAYLYYQGKHPIYGDGVLVVDAGPLPSSPSDLVSFLSSGYFIFYPFTAAVGQKLVRVVARCETEVALPRRMRRPGARGRD